MKDMKYSYQGYTRIESFCGLKLLERDGNTLVILTELPDNPGTSVTNCVEKIATKVLKEFRLDWHDITWIEHYPAASRGFDKKPSYDLVEFDWNWLGRAEHPKWLHLTEEKFSRILLQFEESSV